MKIVTHSHIYHTILALFGVTAFSWEQAKGQEAPISVSHSHSKPGKERGFDAFGFRIALLIWPIVILLLSLSVNSYGQCKPTITADYCTPGNGQVQLTSSLATTYIWNTGATTRTINVPGAGKYTVKVTGTGCTAPNDTTSINVGFDQVVNGNFSAGNTGFTSAYTYVAAPGQLNAQGLYGITADVAPRFPNIMYGRDHTVGNGNSPNNFLAINGADAANKTIWMETVNVIPNTDYYFTVFAMDLSGNLRRDTVRDRFDLNIVSFPTVSVTKRFLVPYGNDTNANPWFQYSFAWNSGPLSGSAQISISEPFIGFVGNNLGFDDISFSRLNPVPLTAGTSSSTVCPGSTISVTSPVTGGSAPFTYSWTGPNGFNSTVQNPPPTVAVSGAYIVTVTDFFGCQKTGTVNVSVTSGITIFANATPNSICAGTPVNLTSSTTSSIPTTLLSENFNSATNTWIKTNNSTGGNPGNAAWTLRPNGWVTDGRTFHSNDNSQFYLSDSRNQGSGTSLTDTRLTSPVLNTMGYSSLSLDFYHYFEFQGVSNERATVEVSTNGTVWTPIATYSGTQGLSNTFAHPVINLIAYINIPTLQIRFHYYALARASYWAIDNVTLSGTSTNYTINWTSNPAGFTSNVANPGNVTPSVNTTYTVIYTNPNPGGCSESAARPVTVNVAPAITLQPQNVSACGVAATFTITSTGTYQWYESSAGPSGPWTSLTNISPYSGVTSNTLTVNPIASKNGFYYHCVVSNGSCTTTSNSVLLTVTGAIPAFSQQPAPSSVCDGNNTSFSVISNGQGFQWEVSTNGGSSYSAVNNSAIYSGVTTAILTISGATLSMNSYLYHCIATIPGCGTNTSSSATLTVIPPPVITVDPTNFRICSNTSHTFTISATGGSTYQWQENSGAGWVNIIDGGIYSGALTQNLTLATIPDYYNGYQYRCVVGNGSCTVTSNLATLSITTPPVISVQPASQAICEGDIALFSLTAISTGNPIYQWRKSTDNGTTWTNISGETSTSLTLNNTLGIGGTQYDCVVTDNCGQAVTSDAAILTYNLPPVSVLQPIDQKSCADFGVFVSFIVDPLPGVDYQWQVKINSSSPWIDLTNDLSGAELGIHSSELMVWTPTAPPDPFTKDGYQYRCILKNSTTLCSKPSNAALLTVKPTPYFFYTPDPASYCAGSSVTLSTTISGAYDYLWKKNSVSTGITTPSIVVTEPGNYSALVTDQSTGCKFERAHIVVTETPASPAVSVSIGADSGTTICDGTSVTFIATPQNAGVAPVYQWKKNGVDILGLNSSSYVDNALANGDVITCVLTANVVCAPNNPATSNQLIMVVDPISTVSVLIGALPGTTICFGTSVLFSATPTNGGTAPTYQWKKNNNPIAGANSATYMDSGLANGDRITCDLTSSLNCTTGSSVTSNELRFTVNSPGVFNVTGGINCYSGGAGIAIGLNNSQSTVTYRLLKGGVDTGITRTGPLGPFAFVPAQTATGVYTVQAELNGCNRLMNGSATIFSTPTITLGAFPIVCPGSTTANLPYSATTGSPDQFSITYTGAAPGAGFIDVTNAQNAQLPASPIALVVPAAAPSGVYTATLTVRNSATPCVSSNYPITITVNNIEVDGSVGPTLACYPTLQSAFAAINSGTHQGAITVKVIRSTNETGTAVLNASGTGSASYTSVFMYPTSTGLSISGNLASPLVDLNGADNVTINGNINGVGSLADLTISNTSTSAVPGTSTIRMQADATSNLVTYCNVQGSSTAAANSNGGNIWIASGSTGTGNDNNTISYCNIGPAGTNLPSREVFLGGTLTNTNNGNHIINNNLFDYFSATVSSTGIYVDSGTIDGEFSNNRFYQTSLRTQTTGTQHSAIWIANTSGNNYQVIGNTIGFANVAGTGLYSISGTGSQPTNTKFFPIYLNVGTTTATSIQNNTIAGIAMSGNMSGTSDNSPFTAIYVSGGAVNIGTITGNTIGSMTTTGSISYTTASVGNLESHINGIYNRGNGTWNTSNNNIGGITTANTQPGYCLIYGLRGNIGTSNWLCNNNIIGGTIANSINNTSINNVSLVHGIFNSSYTGSFTGNIIRNLTAAGGTGTTIPVIGINIDSPTGNQTVSQNTISNLTYTNTGVSAIVTGIYFNGSGGANLVERNFIYLLNNASNITSAAVYGIFANSGTTTYQNNIISFNYNTTTSLAQIVGFNDGGGTNFIYHNTISLSGRSLNPLAVQDVALNTTSGNQRNIRNNIFANARTDNGAHLAVNISSSANLTIGYNDYVGTLTGITQDPNSVVIPPVFFNAAGTSLTDFVPAATTLTGTNTLLVSIPLDIDGTSRCVPTMGAQENSSVPATPGSISGALSPCAGITGQTYSVAAVPFATTYTWTVPTGWSITAGQGTISIAVTVGSAGQDGTITANAGNSCGTSAASSLSVTVNSPPTCTITGGTVAVCPGSTTTWSAATGMSSYDWTGPGSFTASTQDITIGTAGIYSVTITNANGCKSNCSRTLTLNPLPTSSPIYHR
jgi:hypothetical protein